MPTAARLISAVCLAALAWLVTDMVKENVFAATERDNFGYLVEINAAIGLLVGWFVLGGRVGVDYVTAISIGLTGVVALLFWVLLIQAGAEMFDRAMARRYDGPMEAITAIFEIGAEYGRYLLEVRIIGTLIAGGIFAGVLAEATHRRWS